MKIIYTALVALVLTFGTTAFAEKVGNTPSDCNNTTLADSAERNCFEVDGINNKKCLVGPKNKDCTTRMRLYLNRCWTGMTHCQPK